MSYNYPALDYDDYQNAYVVAANAADHVSQLVSAYDVKPPESLRVYDYLTYEADYNKVGFNYYPFKGKLAKIMGGSLMVGDARDDKLPFAEVGINAGTYQGRQNHTALHEVMHYHVDVPNGYAGESFPSLFEHGNYTPEEQFRELTADFGAAMMHIPTPAMLTCIQQCRDLYQGFSQQFASSYGGNFTRVRDYLAIELGYNWGYACNVVTEYQRNPTSESLLYNIVYQVTGGHDVKGVTLDGDHSAQWDFRDSPFD